MRGGDWCIYMLSSERFIMSAVMCTFVAHHPQQLIMPSVQDAAQGKALREGYLGRIFCGAAPRVIYRP